jgi:hypothetical protein
VSLWLLYMRGTPSLPRPANRGRWLGWPLLAASLLLYAFGRSQDIIMFEVARRSWCWPALLLLFCGGRALRAAWFPLFFLLFMVPLPEALVAAVTTPLKSAVSAVASAAAVPAGLPGGPQGVV